MTQLATGLIPTCRTVPYKMSLNDVFSSTLRRKLMTLVTKCLPIKLLVETFNATALNVPYSTIGEL